MKKRFTVLFLAAILALSATACNSGSNTESKSEPQKTSSSSALTESKKDTSVSEISNEESNKEQSSEPVETSITDADAKELFQNQFIDIVSNGKYYIKMTMDTASLGATATSGNNVPDSITMTMALDKDNKKLYCDLGIPMMGINKIIVADGKQWMLMDEQKIAYYQNATGDIESTFNSMGNASMLNTDSIEYVSCSKEKFKDKSCVAVVYSVYAKVNAATGATVSGTPTKTEQTYYFDETTNALVGIKINVNGKAADVVIDELTSIIPDDLFVIPSNYKKSDISKMMNTSSN